MLLKRSRAVLAILAGALLMTPIAHAHGISEEARRRMLEGGDLQYLILGAEHMITGYDHLLFLFGVMFFLTSFSSILRFVTAFTIGHTITLITATYLGITANYFFIDAIIALTVIYKGFENLDGFPKVFGAKSPNLLLMVLVFGLIHGFGLSTRLQQLPIREDSGLLMHILSFNVGVEFGQIAALAVMWLVLNVLRRNRHFGSASKFVNAGLMFAGFGLFLMQTHGLFHTTMREDYPISRDDHIHAHLEMGSMGQPAAANPADAPEPKGSAQTSDEAHGHSHAPDGSHYMPGDVKPAMTVAATPNSPEYVQLANNVEIIESVDEAMNSGSATFTHEGYFGPLLFGEELRAYSLRLEPGMFLSEHPHPTESIIYTLGGRWVLCSEGKRKVMEAGSLFHFGSNMPTGWEAPFAEGAEILIFKKKRDGDNYESFVEGIGEMAATLDEQMKDGEPFYYHQLESDHPAIQFAKSKNPDFGSVLEASKARK
ncbi:HupE/UreJ family protein [Hyphomonas sp.]|uniref:HupE/UreJ family protein n=1 Tax=Hyphomonas sp. TaxID=87 RepID=UPI0025C437FF|nr:HupE/UreJ family protein [Hyphomonas sp.]